MVARRGFDVPGAKPAGLSYMRPCRRARQESSRVLLSTPISIGAVREVTHRGAIQRREVMEAAITYAPCHEI
jgi:hypothetical protein